MKLQIIQFSASKDKHLAALEADYENRLKPYYKLEVLTLSATKSDDRNTAQSEERDRLIPKLDPQAYVIALDERGTGLTSPEFAALIKEQRDFGAGSIQLIIGGSHGLHPDILDKANFRLSFSAMTFTHEMIRLFLKEQLYRAALILKGRPYHK